MNFKTMKIEYSAYTFDFNVDNLLKKMDEDGWELICTTSPLGGFSDIIYKMERKTHPSERGWDVSDH